MSDRRSVKHYLKFFQNLSIVYKESILSSDRPKIDPYFDYLEKEASNFPLDELEEKLVSFICSSKSATKNDCILLIKEVILYKEKENSSQIIQTAFRVYFPARMKLSQFLKRLSKQQIELPSMNLKTKPVRMIIVALIVYFIIFLKWQSLVCQENCDLNAEWLYWLLSTGGGFILLFGTVRLLEFIIKRIAVAFEKIHLKNRRQIKLPELRLFFTELEKLSLSPVITIEVLEDFQLMMISLQIQPDVKFLQTLL
jgi:hypothetical protein